MTINKLDEIPYSIMEEIKAFSDKSAQKQITLEDLINIKTSQPSSQTIQLPDTEVQIDLIESTVSTVSTVTDFSPPKDWRE
jgi:hypothetical protein